MESERAMTSSRSAKRPSTASALGQEEQPWLVNSSTTAFEASVTFGGAASAVSGVATWAGATPDRPAKPAMSAMSAMSRMSWTNPCLFLIATGDAAPGDRARKARQHPCRLRLYYRNFSYQVRVTNG